MLLLGYRKNFMWIFFMWFSGGIETGSARRNAQPPGEGLGEGSRRLMSGTWLWKDPEGTRRPGSNDLARRPRWAADRFAHSARPGRNISLHPGPFLRPSAPLPQGGANLAPRKAKMGPTTRPDGVQRRQNRTKMVQRRDQNRETVR